MKRGEHKSLQTDRVILMPGPDEEVAWVNKMYRWPIEEDLSFREIADRLSGRKDRARPRRRRRLNQSKMATMRCQTRAWTDYSGDWPDSG
ncbi:hypothetical protein [Rhodovulum sulfidophilum]|uniref:hypothetical protein n=1 Tax=Rhodovulum sulfidophilum TaxID=35806 RepID=UPI00192EB463|nr:hypothetical protein [Rhodovulum sulfidophilum]